MPEHAAIIAVLILERPMCVDCIADKANLPPADVKRYLDVIHRSLEVRSHEGRCRTCGNQRPVFSFSRLE
jgi:hypothetical protein